MLALWALFVLSAMVVAWALDIDSRLALNGEASRVLEAEAMASSGAEIALHPAREAGHRRFCAAASAALKPTKRASPAKGAA